LVGLQCAIKEEREVFALSETGEEAAKLGTDTDTVMNSTAMLRKKTRGSLYVMDRLPWVSLTGTRLFQRSLETFTN